MYQPRMDAIVSRMEQAEAIFEKIDSFRKR